MIGRRRDCVGIDPSPRSPVSPMRTSDPVILNRKCGSGMPKLINRAEKSNLPNTGFFERHLAGNDAGVRNFLYFADPSLFS